MLIAFDSRRRCRWIHIMFLHMRILLHYGLRGQSCGVKVLAMAVFCRREKPIAKAFRDGRNCVEAETADGEAGTGTLERKIVHVVGKLFGQAPEGIAIMERAGQAGHWRGAGKGPDHCDSKFSVNSRNLHY